MPTSLEHPDPVRDPNRLAALRHLSLLDSPPDPAFDRLTRLAATVLGAPIALVSLVDSERQFFKEFFWATRAVALPAPDSPHILLLPARRRGRPAVAD